MSEEMCPCGKPLHYTDEAEKAFVDSMVDSLGLEVEIEVRGVGVFSVNRHYIALHGFKGEDLEELAAKGIVRKIRGVEREPTNISDSESLIVLVNRLKNGSENIIAVPDREGGWLPLLALGDMIENTNKLSVVIEAGMRACDDTGELVVYRFTNRENITEECYERLANMGSHEPKDTVRPRA
jgi:hypothetical protein